MNGRMDIAFGVSLRGIPIKGKQAHHWFQRLRFLEKSGYLNDPRA